MARRPSDLEIASQWSEWVERHGRYSREVAVERCGSSGDTIRNSAPVHSSAGNLMQDSTTFVRIFLPPHFLISKCSFPCLIGKLSATVSRSVLRCSKLRIGIEPRTKLRQIVGVKATAKRRAKSEAELLDHAAGNLMRALKRDMLKKDGRIDYEKLRKEGYSERLLAKLEQA